MITTILFDFDGTIIDTNAVIIQSWQHTYRHYLGREADLQHITTCFGEPLLITMAREFPDVPPEESAAVYRDWQKENADKLVKLFPGIPDMLRALRRAGYRIGIVTSRTRESTQRYLEMFEIASFFDDMVTCDDTSVHKPDPAPILLGLSRFGAAPEEALMIGDSPFDLKCADNAGVKSVLVDWSIIDAQHSPVGAVTADYHIKKPTEIVSLLQQLNGEHPC